jgi:hypothetical protein
MIYIISLRLQFPKVDVILSIQPLKEEISF